MPIGRKVEYVITRSSGNRGTEIECVGNILRCAKKCDYPSYEIVASIENERKKPHSDTDSLSEMLDNLSQPPGWAHSASSRLSSALDPDRYKPMLRLLSDGDDPFVADRVLWRKFRIQRCELFREYLRSLTQDYSALLAGVRLLMAESDMDRPDLARVLIRNRVSLAIARCRIEARLRFFAFGVRNSDVLKLEVQGMARSLEVLQRHFSFLAESAVWGA